MGKILVTDRIGQQHDIDIKVGDKNKKLNKGSGDYISALLSSLEKRQPQGQVLTFKSSDKKDNGQEEEQMSSE